MTITVINIPGDPIAKKRPRFARRGKFVTTYSDQETEESKFYMLAREQIKEKLSGAVSVRMLFCFKRPKGHYGTGKNAGVVKASSPSHHTKKPDADNLGKFVCDVLNGLAWDDDAQVVNMIIRKRYAEESGSTIIITSAENIGGVVAENGDRSETKKIFSDLAQEHPHKTAWAYRKR